MVSKRGEGLWLKSLIWMCLDDVKWTRCSAWKVWPREGLNKRLEAHLVMPRHEQCQLCLGEVPDLDSAKARDGLVYVVRFNAKLKVLPVPRSLSGVAELRIHHVSCLGREHTKLCNLLRCRFCMYCSVL